MPKTKEKKGEWKRVCFKIYGEHFTWILRHLWSEGSESKAVRLWENSFPDFSDAEHMKTMFIDVVGGRKKFTGCSTEGLDLVKEEKKRKFFDHDRSGTDKGAGSPLIDSWEDVMLKKQLQMLVAELQLIYFRMNRTSNLKMTQYYLGRQPTCTDNRRENPVRTVFVDSWAFIRNISAKLNLGVIPIPAPGTAVKLDHTHPKRYSLTGAGVEYQPEYDLGFDIVTEIMATIDPIKRRFKRKYKWEFVHVTRKDVEYWMGSISKGDVLYDTDYNSRVSDTYREQRDAYRTQSDGTVLSQVLTPEERESYLKYPESSSDEDRKNAQLLMDVPSVEEYIAQQMRAGKREKIEAEDPFKTTWTSGYIDRSGKFYGCADLDHRSFAGEILEALDIDHDPDGDTQVIIDNLKWVKLSRNRFFWDQGETYPNKKQKDAMVVYATGKDMTSINVNNKVIPVPEIYDQ